VLECDDLNRKLRRGSAKVVKSARICPHLRASAVSSLTVAAFPIRVRRFSKAVAALFPSMNALF
jgi:hypothetical protein